MADKRRLQAEIERCHKKVQEGCETFDDIWSKFNLSSNPNQREKFEADLKKEIKKLQRLRDQIKSWLNGNEIRDKQQLQENRKKIENRMERFKVVEKETKTKAYSKEGLGASTKLDPAAKEKREVESWLQDSINSLEMQVDQFESEMETLSTPGGKKKNKDKHRDERLSDLRAKIERHQCHIKNLEKLLRMLNNDAIEVDQIKTIQEDVNYYVDSNQEDDFEENEFIYDDLELDDSETEQFVVQPVLTHTDSGHGSHDHDGHSSHHPTPNHSLPNNQSSNHSTSNNHSKDDIDTRSRHRSSTNSDEGRGNGSHVNRPTLSIAAAVKAGQSLQQTTFNNSSSGSISAGLTSASPVSAGPMSAGSNAPSTPVTSSSPSTPAPLFPQGSSSTPLTTLTGPNSTPSNSPAVPPSPSQQPHLISYSNAAAAAASHEQLTQPSAAETRVTNTPPQSSTPNSVTSGSVGNSVSNSSIPSPVPSPAASVTDAAVQLPSANSQQLPAGSAVHMNGPINGSLQKPSNDTLSSLRAMAQAAESSQFGQLSVAPAADGGTATHKNLANSTPASSNLQTSSIRLSPLLGVAPLGPKKLTKEHCYQAEMLTAAYQHVPFPSDSERLRHYLPRNPCATPSYYPQQLPLHGDTVEFFQRLSTEALFFIFYYMEGTKAQYLAAKALKKQSWRFHTKYMMWFQRHDEPRSITDEYEQGTYIYFDYEKWGQRRKEGFVFEYRYLEDRDLN